MMGELLLDIFDIISLDVDLFSDIQLKPHRWPSNLTNARSTHCSPPETPALDPASSMPTSKILKYLPDRWEKLNFLSLFEAIKIYFPTTYTSIQQTQTGLLNLAPFSKTSSTDRKFHDLPPCPQDVEGVMSISVEVRGINTYKPMKLSDKEIVEMIFFPVVNEACSVLTKGIVVKAADLDIASIIGMGFPPWSVILWSRPNLGS